jgi:hypothetical protein
MGFLNRTYYFKDIPLKREYMLVRLRKVYNLDGEDLKEATKILDSIKIVFRDQPEKGASHHESKMIYISTKEIERYGIKNDEDAIKYFEDPRSVIVHETTHIFQNIFKAFPHVNYLDDDGKIIYDKYVTDLGENQARVEQIIELLSFGFEKGEILNLLYSRKHRDPRVWKALINQADKIRLKYGKSKLPPDDEEAITIQQETDFWPRPKGDRGNNYEKNYISSGHWPFEDIKQY